MNGSKWTWLRDKSLEIGKIEAAALAQEIEDILYECYGSTTTDAWQKAKENEILEMYYEDSDSLIDDTLFCRGCEESGGSWNCEICEFGKKAGKCGNPNSLFMRFCEAFEWKEPDSFYSLYGAEPGEDI